MDCVRFPIQRPRDQHVLHSMLPLSIPPPGHAHLHPFTNLAVPGGPRADLLIRSILHMALTVPHCCCQHPWQPLEGQLHRPEAPSPKGRFLHAVSLHQLQELNIKGEVLAFAMKARQLDFSLE